MPLAIRYHQRMRIALVSDIHGNLTALDAVIADLERVEPDLVVLGGDLAVGGPRPAAVIDRVRELGWPSVLGNSDEVLWNLAAAPLPAPVRESVELQVHATRALLGEESIEWLRTLPREWKGEGVGLVHAVPGNLWTVVPVDADDATLATTFGTLGAAIAVYGHIHHAYIRPLPGLIVANTGSVGAPFDGDIRASYLLIEDGTPQPRRVEYDLEGELALLVASGYPVPQGTIEARRRAVPPP
jgi:putative phosphoesterase